MKRFLEQGGFHAFTTTFEDLHGLKQGYVEDVHSGDKYRLTPYLECGQCF